MQQPNTSNQKILVILTNEAFLNSTSSSPSANPPGHKPQPPHKPPHGSEPHGRHPPSGGDHHKPQPPRSQELPHQPSQSEQRQYKFTGIDAVEVSYIWTTLARKLDVDFASPRGGPTAADPHTMEMLDKDEKLRRELKEDRELLNLLGHTFPIKWIDPSEYQAVIIPGSHGAMIDLPENEAVSRVISEIYDNGGVVAAIGHGAAALINCRSQRSNNEYLIKGKRMCCFSESEEKEAKFADSVPYCLESKLRERGAKLENERPFESKVLEDSRIVTGQNTKSTHEFVKSVAKSLGVQESELELN